MNPIEEARRELRLRLLDNFRRGTADDVVAAIEKLIDAKLFEFSDDLLSH